MKLRISSFTFTDKMSKTRPSGQNEEPLCSRCILDHITIHSPCKLSFVWIWEAHFFSSVGTRQILPPYWTPVAWSSISPKNASFVGCFSCYQTFLLTISLQAPLTKTPQTTAVTCLSYHPNSLLALPLPIKLKTKPARKLNSFCLFISLMFYSSMKTISLIRRQPILSSQEIGDSPLAGLPTYGRRGSQSRLELNPQWHKAIVRDSWAIGPHWRAN